MLGLGIAGGTQMLALGAARWTLATVCMIVMAYALVQAVVAISSAQIINAVIFYFFANVFAGLSVGLFRALR